MSLQFWTQLILALLVLATAITLVHQYRSGALRTLRARLLRKKLALGLRSLLPVLTAELSSGQANLFPIFRLRADLEALMQKGHLLFSNEHRHVSDFLARLSGLLARHDAGLTTAADIDEVALIGERAVLELTEIGF